ncbi:MAG: class B sortase [Bacillota bacterium]|nr:class B sortase [Bacillota bacterium]
MIKLKKIVSILSNIEDVLCFMFCMFLFLIGLYSIIDSYLVYEHANDDSLLKYKPGYSEESNDQEIIGNMVAWLTVDKTNIDYPVMQGENNEEYLNKDPYGEYSLSGSIFLDSRNKPDFSDTYSLIYGHHMEGDHMFGSLHSFLKEKYFKKHKHGTLIVGNTIYNLKIFAVMNAKATESEIFDSTEVRQSKVLSYIKTNSKYYNKKIDIQLTDRIIALSTCKYPDSVYRVVVFAKLDNPHQIEKSN